ncbi:MAG: PQQ-binding-like beta-propeller repeat protein, partial [Armatimonadota bacterium]
MSSRRTHSLLGGAVAAVALSAVLGVAASADWPQLRGDAQHTGVSGEKVLPPLALLWRHTGGFQNANSASAVIAGDTAFFVTKTGSRQGGRLFAVETKTGTLKWAFPKLDTGLPAEAIFTTTPTVDNGKVYVGASDGAMYVIDAATGDEVVKFNTGRTIGSAAIVEDGVLYFGSNNGTLYALDPKTGDNAPGFRSYNAGESIVSSPLLADTMMILTTGDNTLHALKRATGILKWKYRLPYGTLPNGLTYADGSLYVPSGRQLFAIQPASGATRWTTQIPEDITAAPVAAEGVVYVACRSESGPGAKLYAVNASNGRGRWEQPASLPYVPTAAPVVAGDILYFAAARGTLLAVAKDTGKLLWQYRLERSSNKPVAETSTTAGIGGGPGGAGRAGGGFGAGRRQMITINDEVNITAPVAVSDGTIYIVSGDGTLSAFRSDAPDMTGPVVTDQFPKPGASVNGKPPFVAALKMTDFGSGLDVATIEGSLDGKPVDTQFDELKNWIYLSTTKSDTLIENTLANGRHTVRFAAKDFKGNITESEWSFVVDNNLPTSTKVAPVAPKKKPADAAAPSNPTGGVPSPPGGGGAARPGRGGGRRGAGAAGGGRGGL